MKEIPVNAREKVLQKKVADPFPEDLKKIESFLQLSFSEINFKKRRIIYNWNKLHEQS